MIEIDRQPAGDQAKNFKGLLLALSRKLALRQRPHAMQLALWVLLVSCLWSYARIQPFPRGDHQPTGQIISILSFFPRVWIELESVDSAVRAFFIVGSILWLLQLALPWSAWASTAGFTALMALIWEQSTFVGHSTQLPNMIMVIFALAATFERRASCEALRRADYWVSELIPCWYRFLALFQIGLFYSWTGVGKLLESGLGWANGVSLQLWVHVWGRDGLISSAILESRTLAVTFQAAVLVIETSAILFMPFRRLRIVYGLALLGFHIGQELVFGYPFGVNTLLVLVIVLPAGEFFERLCRRFEVSYRGRRPLPQNMLFRALAARLDVIGLFGNQGLISQASASSTDATI